MSQHDKPKSKHTAMARNKHQRDILTHGDGLQLGMKNEIQFTIGSFQQIGVLK